jgi:aspartyl-tRNA synthetase
MLFGGFYVKILNVMERISIKEIIGKEGEEVKLAGWVNARRDHGKIIFIDLRDRSGLAQIVFLPDNQELYQSANNLRDEWVIEVIGKVNPRPEKMSNDKISTGGVEVEAKELKVLNQAKTPPFEISGDKEAGEQARLKYRYLDLRRPKMQRNIILRHQAIKFIRDFLDKKGFIEIETPILTKSTPEGARDFLVPSRLQPGKFYALPQAPQQLKQLLMVAGFEKYFQVARCFRDEDLRGDRQPEFTQLDIEMSFISQEDILKLVESFCLEVIEELAAFDKNFSKKLTFEPFLRLDYQEAIEKYDTDKPDLRKNKKDPDELAFAWILNWPLFERDKEENRYNCCHHIFTAPQEKDVPLLEKKPLSVRSWQHDLVLNGHEIAGGSIRNHQREIQEQIFRLVGLNQEQISEKFGHLLRAFEYGAPPHGGIALGIDRFLMLLCNEESVREVIAFPKTGDGSDLMMEAPSPVSPKQLKELKIKINS